MIELLPPDVADALPCVFTYRGAVDREVLALLRRGSTGMSLRELANTIDEQHHTTFQLAQHSYLAAVDRRQQLAAGGERRLDAGWGAKPTSFGSFDSPTGWAGFTVSSAYLGSVFCRDILSRKPILMRELQGVGGSVLRADHTFRMASCLRQDGGRPASCVHTVMNEYGEVVTYAFTQSTGQDELRPQFRGLRRRYELNEWGKATILYVDTGCCSETSVFREEFNPDGLQKLDGFHGVNRCVSHPFLTPPECLSRNAGPRLIKQTEDAHEAQVSYTTDMFKAVYVLCLVDYDVLVNAIMAARGCGEAEAIAHITPALLRKHVRRVVPEAAVLAQRVSTVQEFYMGVEATDGTPLFKPGAYCAMCLRVELVLRLTSGGRHDGCLSSLHGARQQGVHVRPRRSGYVPAQECGHAGRRGAARVGLHPGHIFFGGMPPNCVLAIAAPPRR